MSKKINPRTINSLWVLTVPTSAGSHQDALVCQSVSLSASNIEKRYKRTNSAGIRLLTRCEAKETHFAYL